MKKTLLFFSSLFLLSGAATAQIKPAQYHDNASGKQFYVEAGGAGMVFSANFDSRFSNKSPFGFGYRVGLGFDVAEVHSSNSDSYHTRSFVTVPFGLNYVFGRSDSNHAFEIGAGATVLTKTVSVYDYDEGHEGNMIGHFSFMYRRQPIDGGFTWRIGFTPIIGTGGQLVPSCAGGIGYSF